MAILVTGGAGYIGSHMVHELHDAGEPVVVLDNLSTGFRFLLPSAVPIVVGHTGDQELVAKLIVQHNVDAIIHFAASIVVPDSISDPLGYYRNNTVNTALLLQAAVAAGVRRFDRGAGIDQRSARLLPQQHRQHCVAAAGGGRKRRPPIYFLVDRWRVRQC
jgi:UDP-glucose 4-epimerase